VKWLSQLVVEGRNERKRITIVGQAQTRQQSPSEILVSEAARTLFQPKEGRLQESITLRNDDGAGYRDRKLEQRVVRLSAFRLSESIRQMAAGPRTITN
jgi:hypothetical protein